MAQTKTLISITEVSRLYEIRDDATNVLVCMSEEPIITVSQEREQSIRTKAIAALVANNAFINLSNPDAAAVRLQVQRLTRENNALIRLALQQFDSDDA